MVMLRLLFTWKLLKFYSGCVVNTNFYLQSKMPIHRLPRPSCLNIVSNKKKEIQIRLHDIFVPLLLPFEFQKWKHGIKQFWFLKKRVKCISEGVQPQEMFLKIRRRRRGSGDGIGGRLLLAVPRRRKSGHLVARSRFELLLSPQSRFFILGKLEKFL